MFGNKTDSRNRRPQRPQNERRDDTWGRDYGVDDDQDLESRNRDDLEGDYRYANQNFGQGATEGYTDYHYGREADSFRGGYGRFSGTDGNYRAGTRDWRNEQNASEYIAAGVHGAGSGEAYGKREMRGTTTGVPFSAGKYSGKGPKGYRRSDQRIHEEVCEALTHDPHVDASNVEVRVENGTVILAGSVESRRMKRAAEEIAEHIRGVDDVRNELRVGSVTLGEQSAQH